jgi:CheY-like chemotaxis protein
MPGMDGFEALKKIKENEKFSRLPVIIITNLDNEEDMKQASENGVDAYFVKSKHVPADLAEEINKILNK